MNKLSFVVPAYNEEENIPQLYKKILGLTQNYKYDWEIIFINDGSVDNTLKILNKLSNNDKHIKFIDLSRNFGHQSALTAGLSYASGNAIISMDCDLQDPPEIIDEMIKKWENGFDIVYARRKNYRKDNFLKKVGSQIFYRLLGNFSEVNIPRNVGDFRLIDKKVLREINKMPEKSRYIRGIVAWTGYNHTFVDYYRPDRKDGESNYSIAKLAQLGMSGMLGFSVLPLRIGLVLGIISILVGLVVLLIQIVDFFVFDAYYHLYKWLVVVIIIFIGFLFMLIWIIGEYIGKIYDEVRGRPIYIIKNKVNFE